MYCQDKPAKEGPLNEPTPHFTRQKQLNTAF